jgi:hypothetical protein
MDTNTLNNTILLVASTCLFSTGHWIGGTVLATVLILGAVFNL